MKDGFWMNYRTGQWFLIDEHENWIREPANATKLGLPRRIQAQFKRFPRGSRNVFLPWLMKRAPIIRVRGYGVSVSFEFHSKSLAAPLQAIRKWARLNAGPMTQLHIVNFAAGKPKDILFEDLQAKARSRKAVNPTYVSSGCDTLLRMYTKNVCIALPCLIPQSGLRHGLPTCPRHRAVRQLVPRPRPDGLPGSRTPRQAGGVTSSRPTRR